mgnify:FL=1|jgi:hypothetical protein
MPTNGDIAVGVAAVLVALALSAMTAYQYGYDAARAECKPLPKVEFKQMSHKQQVKLVKFENRDKGWIK